VSALPVEGGVPAGNGAARDIVFGLVTLAAGAFCLLWLIPVGIKIPPRVPFAAASPDFYPRIVAWATVALGVALTGIGFASVASGRRIAAEAFFPAGRAGAVRSGLATAALFLYLLLIQPLGLIAATSLLMVAHAALYEDRRMVIGVVLALLLPYANFLVFFHGLGVPFPLGIFDW